MMCQAQGEQRRTLHHKMVSRSPQTSVFSLCSTVQHCWSTQAMNWAGGRSPRWEVQHVLPVRQWVWEAMSNSHFSVCLTVLHAWLKECGRVLIELKYLFFYAYVFVSQYLRYFTTLCIRQVTSFILLLKKCELIKFCNGRKKDLY